MKFEELVLERYGAFSGRSIAFRRDAALHVVLGVNEAGKTTALSAIGDLLFGFPQQSPYSFRHEAKSLRIGARLRLRDGKELAFRRRKGRDRTIVDAEDAALPDDLLAPVLGGLTRGLFSAEFGLTAQALRDGGHELAKAGGGLSEALAASSAGMSALSQLRAELDNGAANLFSARRVASKPFYVALDAYQTAERNLRDALVTGETWSEAKNAVAQAQAQAEARKAELEALGREIARLARVKRTGPKLRQIDLWRAELAALGGARDIAAESLAHWRAALTQEADLAARLADLDAEAASSAARRDALHVDADLLASGGVIDGLRERIGAIDKALSDLPRRQQAQRDAADRLDAAARSLGFADRRELLAQLPTDPAIARAQALIGRGKSALERQEAARERLARSRAEFDRRAREDATRGACVDPEPLRRRLDAFADIAADCDHLRRETEACAAERAGLQEAFARLAPRPASLDALAAAPLPEAAQIAAAQRTGQQHADAARDLAARRLAAEEAVQKAAAQIAALAGRGATITRERLLALRADRDAAIAGLRHASTAADLDRLAALAREIDFATDWLLADSERAALLQDAEKQRDAAERALAAAAAQAEAQAQRGAALQAAWAALWRDSGVEPGEPALMSGWLERVAALLARRAKLADREAGRAALARKLDELHAPLAALCADLRIPAAADAPLDLLHRGARAALAAAQQDWSDARARQASTEQALQTIVADEADLAQAEAAVADWRAAWPEAVSALGLRAQADLAEAEAALAIWRKTPEQVFEHRRETRSVDGIQHDLDVFSRDVAALCTGAQADLAALAPREALDALTRRLAEARATATERQHLAEAAAKRAEAMAMLARKREAAGATLLEARNALAPDADAPLETALLRCERSAQLAADLTRADADLSLEGQDEAGLRAEAQGLDMDTLDALIAARAAEHKQLVHDIESAGAALSDRRAQLGALERGRDADAALAVRTEAGAEIVAIARGYLARAAAARLAGRAIEQHRAAVQTPVIARASAMFARITGGAFDRLRIDYDDRDRPVLAGARADGAGVAIDQMSEGTRDQLFLALRLALLESRAAEPLPFIGDDLLASFDDARTAQALDLLAASAQDQQVILFTHHAHVAEIARNRPGVDIDIIEL